MTTPAAITKQLDSKTLSMAGAVVALLFALYIIWQLVSNDVSKIATEVSAFSAQSVVDQKEYREVLTELKGVIEDNNRLIESFLIQRR